MVPTIIVHGLLLMLTTRVASIQNQVVLDADIIPAETVRDKLLDSAIIPDVLDDFEPSVFPIVIYPSYAVNLGNEIPTKYVSHPPAFGISNLPGFGQREDRTYTFVLSDPDATSRDNPKWSEMCHWVLTDIPDSLWLDSISIGPDIITELVSYLAPSPPKKTGPHRYVFVVLEGNSTNVEAPRKRKHWGYRKIRHGIRDWAAENGLKVVGANFFYAQHKKQ